jgi:SPP1 gp7 family putative phage head morphogenesis protein
MGVLQALTEAYQLTTGACLWLKMRAGPSSPGVVRLVPYSGAQFTTEAANDRIYGRFKVETAEGPKYYEPEDVVHFREINPGSFRTPLSKLDVALSLLDLGHQINRTVRNFMRKALFPGGVISPDAAWNPEDDEFDQYKDAIRAWHGGAANAGEPLVVLGGTTVSGVAVRLKDLLPDEILDRIEATVASVYGVPPVVLGWLVGLKNSPWSQMSEARRMTYEDTAEPRWRANEKVMTRQLLPIEARAAGIEIRYDTSDVRALQHDEAARADTASKMRQEWTVDERRVYTGMEPFGDERGEQIGSSGGGGFPDSGSGNEPEPPPVEEDEDDKADLFRAPDLKLAATPKGLLWLLFDANCKISEAGWERVVARVLKHQKREVERLARKYLEDVKATDPGSAGVFVSKVEEWLESDEIPRLLKVVHPLVFSTARGAVKSLAAKVQLSFTLFEDGLLGYAERESAFLASTMGKTTGKAVAEAVEKGLAEGEIVSELTKRLEGLPAFDRARAKMTARTETTRAWNGAQRAGMSDYQASSGRQVFKTWLSSQDDRVRDEHIDLDGTQLPVDSTFENGLTEPGEPNCRCTLIYSIADSLEE